MRTEDFNYVLPRDLIAHDPVVPRDAARLLVYQRANGQVAHKQVRDLPDILDERVVLVLNSSAVFPARMVGTVAGKPVEVLLLRQVSQAGGRCAWSALVKPGKRFSLGAELVIADDFTARVEKIFSQAGDFGGNRLLSFPAENFWEQIMRYGKVPLPPYLDQSSATFAQYQTVFAQEQGSVAAPTAGLHFTEELLATLRGRGVEILFVTLHVGVGTFKPVTVENLLDHRMHHEYFSLSPETAMALNKAKQAGKKIIAVGTTSVRVLESSVVAEAGTVQFVPKSGETDIFIYPGYQWRAIAGLLTNFHLPKSSLLMLVAALVGREKLLEIYGIAIKERYRFFSFGDAMLIF